MSQVTFNQVPGNILVPFYYSEFNSGGTPYAGDARALYIGQKTSAGNATAAIVYGPVQSELDAIARFGKGSMLHTMFNIAKRNAPLQPFWALPLADPSGAAAAVPMGPAVPFPPALRDGALAALALRATVAHPQGGGQPGDSGVIALRGGAAAAAALAFLFHTARKDLRGDAEYKTAMAGEMTRRAILIAASRCH